MYKIYTTHPFEKDLRLCKKRNYDLNLLKEVIDLLQKDGKLPRRYKPHKLSGNYVLCWECHIKPDWLLVWKQNEEALTLLFTNTGTHADLF